MIHFVYPNVIPKKELFIGCGRYTILPRDKTITAEYNEIGETPNTPNRSQVEYALQLLSPESYDSDQSVVEKLDQPQYRYQGNSLDLAYFLAHTNRARNINTKISGDIWCTGAIEVKDGSPFLRKVDGNGFRLKLKQFLSKENHDTIFIVPAANMQKEGMDMAVEYGVQVISVQKLTTKLISSLQNSKTILKVLPNELSSLIEWFFQPYHSGTFGEKWFALGLILAVSLFGCFWYFFNAENPTRSDIESLMQDGKLIAARQLTEKSKGGSSSLENLLLLMNTPVDYTATMIIQKNGKSPIKQYPLAVNSMAELTLSHDDNFRLVVSAENSLEELYLYVYQIDQLDRTDCIFPKIQWELENPINADQWPVRIPQGEGDWLFLDQLPLDWKDGMTETLHILISPWRANDIEATYNSIESETDRTARNELLLRLKAQLGSRQSANIPSITYREFSFYHK